MAVITAAVAVGAVAAGAAVAKGMAAKSAAKKAASAQGAGYDALEYVDIDKMNDTALAGDKKRFENSLNLQKEVDPTVAGLREEGAKGMLEGLKDDGANDLLKQLTEEGQTDSPKRAALINQLFDQAQTELDSGATLPPEFQQELVRSGLEKTGAAGTTGSGAAGVENRTLLGRAGLDLQAHRRDQAASLLSTADALKQRRAAILADTLGASNSAKNQTAARQANAYAIGAAGVPQAGLSGADLVNLNLTNLSQKNQATLGKAGVKSNLALANGAANQEIIGGVASGLTTAVGGVGGGGGGMIMGLAGGGGGGGAAAPSNYGGLQQYPYNQQQPYRVRGSYLSGI